MMTFFKIILAEMKKMICKKYVIFVLMFLTAIIVWNMYSGYGGYGDHQAEWSGEERLYKNVNGQLTEEKYNYLLSEMEALQDFDLNEDYDEKVMEKERKKEGKYGENPVADALIIQSAINRCKLVLKNEEDRQRIIQRAKENIEEYSTRTDADYDYRIAFNKKVIRTYENQPQVYIMSTRFQDSWYSYFGFSMYSPLLIMFLIMIIVPVFVYEKESGMQNVIGTYSNGKTQLFLAKASAVVFVSIISTIYFEIIQLLLYKIFIPDLKGIKYPIQSVIPQCPFNLTIGGFILIKLIYAALASVMFGTAIMFFSVLFSKRIQSIAVSFLFAIVTYGVIFYQKIWLVEIMRDSILEHVQEILSGLKTYLFSYLFYPMEYYSGFECVNILGHPVFTHTVISIITISSIIIIQVLAYLFYTRPQR